MQESSAIHSARMGLCGNCFAGERAMFMMHQGNQIHGVDSGHAGHVVQYEINAFIMHFPRIGAPVNFKDVIPGGQGLCRQGAARPGSAIGAAWPARPQPDRPALRKNAWNYETDSDFGTES